MLSSSQERIPARLGRYQVRGRIAEGGMAHVYLGSAPNDASPERRVVALKALKGAMAMNLEYTSMFTEEAAVMERLHHPHIVKVVELGAERTQLFMALELLQGQSLWSLWRRCREREVRLRYDLLAYVGACVASALHAAHELRHERTGELMNVVHRDVNPTNIFLTYDGGVKLLDFGLVGARAGHGRAMVRGKLGYMAPEQAQDGPVDRRADVFSLAVTLWELSTDRRLFRVEDDDETRARLLRAEVPNPMDLVEGYPPALWQILRRALSLQPELRPQTAAELAGELQLFLQSQGAVVEAQTLAAVLGALCGEEKLQQAQWIEEALAAPSPSVRTPLQPAAPALDDLASVPVLPPPSSAQLPPLSGPGDSSPMSLPLGDFPPPSLWLGGGALAASSEWRVVSSRSLPESDAEPDSVRPRAALAPREVANGADAPTPRRRLVLGAVGVVALVGGLWWLLS